MNECMVKCVNNCQILSELNFQYLPRDACNSKLIFICCLVCYLIVSMFSSLFTWIDWNACILRSGYFHEKKKRKRNGNWNKCLNVHLWPGPKQSKVYSSASYKGDRSGRSILDCYFFLLNVFFFCFCRSQNCLLALFGESRKTRIFTRSPPTTRYS